MILKAPGDRSFDPSELSENEHPFTAFQNCTHQGKELKEEYQKCITQFV
jgi:hypothetical protein